MRRINRHNDKHVMHSREDESIYINVGEDYLSPDYVSESDISLNPVDFEDDELDNDFVDSPDYSHPRESAISSLEDFVFTLRRRSVVYGKPSNISRFMTEIFEELDEGSYDSILSHFQSDRYKTLQFLSAKVTLDYLYGTGGYDYLDGFVKYGPNKPQFSFASGYKRNIIDYLRSFKQSPLGSKLKALLRSYTGDYLDEDSLYSLFKKTKVLDDYLTYSRSTSRNYDREFATTESYIVDEKDTTHLNKGILGVIKESDNRDSYRSRNRLNSRSRRYRRFR